MKYVKKYGFMLAFALFTLGCNEWEEHNETVDPALETNLLQSIENDPSLSTFAGYVRSTGFSDMLSSSVKFTVWAPTNDALANLDAAIKNDPDRLKEFVGNHIGYQEHLAATSTDRIKLLNGKYLSWASLGREGVQVSEANRLANNGVVHVVGKAIIPLQNSWEVFMHLSLAEKQRTYLSSLTYQQFVDSLGVQIGIDPDTGKPIYEEGTGLVERNIFLDSVANIKKEDSVYTFIVLTDDAFDTEVSKLKDFFKTVTGNEDSTRSLASFFMVKDLAIRGEILPDELPAQLSSVFNVSIPLDQSAIVETHITSNGIVYVLNQLDFQLTDKFPPIRIQGENPTAFSRTDRNGGIHYRYRSWADNHHDLRIFDSPSQGAHALFNVKYSMPTLYSVPYKVYWRAVNDWIDTVTTVAGVSNTAAFRQKMIIDSRPALTFSGANVTPAVALPGKDFGYVRVNRVKPDPTKNGRNFLGDYTQPYYRRPVNIFIVADNSTDRLLNAVVIDYIELVPVF
jgi:uncharacterized surface protein with fasciclin (FAS1) repeats